MITKSKFKAELILLTSNFLSFVYRFRKKKKKNENRTMVDMLATHVFFLKFRRCCSFFCSLNVIRNVQNYLNWFSELWLGPFALETVENNVSRVAFFILFFLLEAHCNTVSYTHLPTDRFNTNTRLPGFPATHYRNGKIL